MKLMINPIKHITSLGRDISNLLFPQYCIGCDELVHDKINFCVSCEAKLSPTDHFEVENNDLVHRLKGRVLLGHSAALYNFIKGGSVQKAIHLLKYKRRPDIGVALGRLYGQRLKESNTFIIPDVLIPIPIHYKKLQGERGYNQSERFAAGIAEVLPSRVMTKILVKHKEIDSQTRKGRSDRFENVRQSFTAQNLHLIANKTVMVVDDVMTTGATIEAACSLLSNVPGITIQVGIIVLAQE